MEDPKRGLYQKENDSSSIGKKIKNSSAVKDRNVGSAAGENQRMTFLRRPAN